jgi:Zn-dependent protease
VRQTCDHAPVLRSGSSIQLARVFGIRIGVDFSWFVVLFLIIFLLSDRFQDVLDSSSGVAYLTAVAAALLFFASIVLHELGHAFAARRQGIEISNIDLWFFGGIARMSSDTRSPGGEFVVAAAGPLVTLIITFVCGAAVAAGSGMDELTDTAQFLDSVNASPLILLLSWLTEINLVLFVFNLIPAFPLDGGRIARAIAWKLTGDRNRGTRFAAWLGQAFAALFIGLGIFLLLSGAPFDGIWLAVLGWFLFGAARNTAVQTAFSERLEGIRVADIMDREPVAIPGELGVKQAEEDFFMRYRWPWFPVVDASGRYLGIVRQERVTGAATAGDDQVTVALLVDEELGDTRVEQDLPIEALLGSEPLRRIGALFAVDTDGVLRGVVTVDQLRRALQRATQPAAPQ